MSPAKKRKDCRAPKVANTKCKSRSDRSKPARLLRTRVSQFSPPTPSSRVPGKVRWNFGHGYQEKFGGILYQLRRLERLIINSSVTTDRQPGRNNTGHRWLENSP